GGGREVRPASARRAPDTRRSAVESAGPLRVVQRGQDLVQFLILARKLGQRAFGRLAKHQSPATQAFVHGHRSIPRMASTTGSTSAARCASRSPVPPSRSEAPPVCTRSAIWRRSPLEKLDV